MAGASRRFRRTSCFAVELARCARAEVEEPQVYALLDLVRERTGQEHVRDVRLEMHDAPAAVAPEHGGIGKRRDQPGWSYDRPRLPSRSHAGTLRQWPRQGPSIVDRGQELALARSLRWIPARRGRIAPRGRVESMQVHSYLACAPREVGVTAALFYATRGQNVCGWLAGEHAGRCAAAFFDAGRLLLDARRPSSAGASTTTFAADGSSRPYR